jgi:hypothetical protein
MVSAAEAVKKLAGQLELFTHHVKDVTPEQARWKPAAKQWSILEVVNHLYDEEREDFRLRFQLTLKDPTQTWPPIDPPRWAVERRYNERDLQESFQNFVVERQKSLEWLRNLGDVKLDNTAKHPGGFELSAGDLLASWVAHDLLHVRQLTRLHYQYWAEQVKPYQVLYAGDW